MKICLDVVNGVSYKLAKRTKHDKTFEILYIIGYIKMIHFMVVKYALFTITKTNFYTTIKVQIAMLHFCKYVIDS
jgi:hypothetical protein